MQLGWCYQADGGNSHYANKECPEFEVRKGAVETTMTVGAFVRECLMPFDKTCKEYKTNRPWICFWALARFGLSHNGLGE